MRFNQFFKNGLLIFLILVIGVQFGGLAQVNAYDAGPDAIGSWETPDTLDSIRDVVVSGTYAYLAIDSFGLQILDISDPTNPTALGFLLITGSIKCIAESVANDRVYIGAGSNLEIINVANKNSPTSDSTYSMGSTVYGLAVDYPYIYVGAWSQSFKIATEASGVIADGDTSSSPWTKGDYYCYGVDFTGNTVYTASVSKGLAIWNVTDKNNPALLGEKSLGTSAYAVGYIGSGRVLVGGVAGYMAIVDCSVPATPIIDGELDTSGGDILDIVISGTAAICADYTYGIVTLGVSGNTPTENTRLPPTMTGYGVDADATYIYGAGGFYDFHIWDKASALAGLEIPGFTLIFALAAIFALIMFLRPKKTELNFN